MAVSEEIQRQMLEEAYSVTPNYSIDPNDERFAQANAGVEQSQTNYNQMMDGMINSTDQYYNDLKNATQQWADKQSQIQQEQTDFAIEKIEQQKEQANKDYIKEQSGAYVDWQKQSNQYGAEAEKMASAGLTGTGYSESSQVSMYNTYQNRVSIARESYNNAVLNYNNAIKDAQLQNNAALAEIAYTSLQKQLELSLQGFQYKNQLINDQAKQNIDFENTKWNRYQDVLQQINTENALAEEVRQYNETQRWNTEQKELDRKFEAEQNAIKMKFEEAQAELDRKHDFALLNAKTEAEKKAADEQHKRDMEKLKKQQEYALAQIKEEYVQKAAYEKKNSNPIVVNNTQSKTSLAKNAISQVTNKQSTSVSNQTSTPSSDATVDMQSVLALGYGPLNVTQLDKMVQSGEIIEYEENGKIKFRRNVAYLLNKKR